MLYNATGLVLAGGKSSRMGSDKALLKLKNQTLLQHSVEKLKRIFKEILISVDFQGKYVIENIKEVTDSFSNCGPLSGIHAGLKEARYEWMFVTACDMPFWEGPFIDELMKHREKHDVVVPILNNRPEPLFALYNKTCLPVIENYINKNIYKVTKFYSDINVKYIDTEYLVDKGLINSDSFMNINTKEDYINISDDDL